MYLNTTPDGCKAHRPFALHLRIDLGVCVVRSSVKSGEILVYTRIIVGEGELLVLGRKCSRSFPIGGCVFPLPIWVLSVEPQQDPECKDKPIYARGKLRAYVSFL